MRAGSRVAGARQNEPHVDDVPSCRVGKVVGATQAGFANVHGHAGLARRFTTSRGKNL